MQNYTNFIKKYGLIDYSPKGYSKSDKTASDLIKNDINKIGRADKSKSPLKIKIPIYYLKILFPELGGVISLFISTNTPS